MCGTLRVVLSKFMMSHIFVESWGSSVWLTLPSPLTLMVGSLQRFASKRTDKSSRFAVRLAIKAIIIGGLDALNVSRIFPS